MKTNQFKSFSPKALAIAALSVASLASCSKDELVQDMSQNGKQNAPGIESRATGEYIVVMKDGSEISSRKRGLSYNKQLEMVEEMAKAMLSDNGIEGIELNDNNTFAAVKNGFTAKLNATQLEALKKDNRVAYIEQDLLVAMGKPTASSGGRGKTKTTTTADPAPTDTTTGTTPTETTTTTTETTTGGTSTQIISWGVTKVGGAGDGTGKTAWIIDSGIDPNHTDLNVDKTRSKSFLTSTQAGTYTSYADEFGHGTQVAGILGAKNNSYGAVGVAAGANLVSLRVMDANGSAYVSKIVAALNWVATYGKAGDVVNLSIGVPASTTLDDAVKNVAAKGIYVAIASGNNGGDAALVSPARVNATNVFTVSGMNSAGVFESWSNYGSPVDYSAPGSNAYTTSRGGGYSYFGGTSAAAPHMAGVLLLTNGSPKYSGYVTGDKDSKPDPIVSK
ncbi:MAG: S8 family serine peptidase [Bacteroidia bacterium]